MEKEKKDDGWVNSGDDLINASGVLARKRSSRQGYWSRHWALYAMLVLPLIFFFIFRYVPMVNILLAWSPNNIFLSVWETGWVGWDNFREAFNNRLFLVAVRNTVMFSVLDLAVGFPAPIILALLFNELKMERFKKVTQTISYMPHFISWVIIGSMAPRLFSQHNGAINNIIYNLGGTPIPFLEQNFHWVATNVSINIWRSIGWSTIIYLAAITSISPELYEAAEIDGASRLRKMWHITLPGIRPVIITLFILTLGSVMTADLSRFVTLQNSLVRGVHGVADVIPTFILFNAVQGNQFHLGAAIGIFQSVIGMILLLTGNWVVKKLGGTGFW